MANPEHVKVVQKGAEAIAKWREVNSPSIILDLSEASFYGANLNAAQLRGADLSAADLSGADLSAADLVGANLKNANLKNANLSSILDYANLIGANLVGANLSLAGLKRANLSLADLKNADLKNADLRYAVFLDTKFDNAEFRHALFGRTIINSVDLSSAQHLSESAHLFNSNVDFETLVRSKGKIPRVFLQGCGLPNSYIDYIPSMIGALNPIDFYSCFISYSHQDKSFATRLHNDLQAKGVRCWLDDHDLKYGEDIYAGVDRGIRLWDKVILCASEASLKSGWVEREVDTAIEMELKHKKDTGKSVLKIIPLNLDEALFDWTGAHAATLRKRLAGDFVDWDKDNEKYEKNFERLVKALNPEQLEPPKPKLFEP